MLRAGSDPGPFHKGRFRQRALVVGLTALADVYAASGRSGGACAHYRESGAMIELMIKAGNFTRRDRDSLAVLGYAGVARYCRGQAPA